MIEASDASAAEEARAESRIHAAIDWKSDAETSETIASDAINSSRLNPRWIFDSKSGLQLCFSIAGAQHKIRVCKTPETQRLFPPHTPFANFRHAEKRNALKRLTKTNREKVATLPQRFARNLKVLFTIFDACEDPLKSKSNAGVDVNHFSSMPLLHSVLSAQRFAFRKNLERFRRRCDSF